MGKLSIKKTARSRAGDLAAHVRADLSTQVRDAHLDEKAAELAERAVDLAERVRESDAVTKAQAKTSELTARAAEMWRESDLDEKAAELATRVREHERTQQLTGKAKRLAEDALAGVGAKLATGKPAELLGIERTKRRGWTMVLVGLVGVGIGYALGMLTAPRRGQDMRDDLRDDLRESAERLAGRVQQTAESAKAVAEPLVDVIRSSLAQDPRTASLPSLSINVADRTVFVRGTVPAGFDEATLRDVISAVPGVADVDLQVSVSA